MLTNEEKSTLSNLLNEKGKRKNQSRLEPYLNVIMYLHFENVSLQVTKEILKEKYSIEISRSSLNDFIRIRKNSGVISKKKDSAVTTSSTHEKEKGIRGEPTPTTNVNSGLHPIFGAAFDSRPDSGFNYDPLHKLKSNKKN